MRGVAAAQARSKCLARNEYFTSYPTAFYRTILPFFMAGDQRKENGTASVATGIYKNSNDGAILDVVVFSARVGLHVNGGVGDQRAA